MAKGHRTRPAVGLALLLLLVASLLASDFLGRGAFGLPDDHAGSSLPATTKGTDQAEASGPVGGVPRASALAFTHDFDSERSLGAAGSGIGYSTIIGGQPGLPISGAGAGSGPGADVANFGLGGGSATGNEHGNPHSYDAGWSGSGVGATPFVEAWPPLPGGGAGGPFRGGGGPGESGEPGGSGSPGGSNGAGGRGGPDSGSQTPDLLSSGTDPGGSGSGAPAISAPSSTSSAAVPSAPTFILVVVGVGMLWGSTKFQGTRSL